MVFFIVLILVFLAIVNAAFKFVKFSDYVTKPIDGSAKKITRESWNADRIIAVAIDSDPAILAVFDPTNSRVSILSMPRDTYAVVPADLGLYPISSVAELGKLKSVASGELFENTLSNFINAPVERYVFFGGNQVVLGETKDEILIKLRQAFSLKHLILAPFQVKNGNLITNLSWTESMKLWWFGRGVRSDHFEYYDLSKNGVISPLILPDGSQAFGADDVGVADFTRRVFTEDGILREQFKIEILNGTDSAGRANKIANILDNIGCDVVRVGNYTGGTVEKTQMTFRDEIKGSLTVRRLNEVFDVVSTKGDFESRDVDITIVLGQDILKRF